MTRRLRAALAVHLAGSSSKLLFAAGALVLGAAGGAGAHAVRTLAASSETSVDIAKVRAALRLRLPRTSVGAIDCHRFEGWCEVVAGSSLFYVDRTARLLVIGHVYDMEARSDLTAARLLDLDPGKLLPRASARGNGEEPDQSAAPRPTRVDLAELPAAGAITWGAANAPRLVVLSDFACGYCRKLTGELAKLRLRIDEHPISIFGQPSRRIAEQVLCASDKVAALHAAYRNAPLPALRPCDVRGLDANEAFARRHGFSGTPVLIREDGAVLEGYRPAAAIKAFVEGRPA